MPTEKCHRLLSQQPTIHFACKAKKDGSLRLVVEEAGPAVAVFLGVLSEKVLLGKTARQLFASDGPLVDSWVEYLLKQRDGWALHGTGDEKQAADCGWTTLQYLQVIKGWAKVQVTYVPAGKKMSVRFSSSHDEEMTVDTGHLMGLEQALWLNNYVEGGGGWEIDLPKRRIYLSRTMATLLGFGTDAVIVPLEKFLGMVHPEDLPNVVSALDNVRTATQTVFCRGVLPDGSLTYFNSYGIPGYNAAGQMTRIIGRSQDISSEKKAAEKLALSEQRFRGIVENSQDLFLVCSPDGALQYLSPNLTELTGYGHERVQGKPARTFLARRNEEAALVRDFTRVMKRREHTKDEYLLRMADGSLAWFLICMSAIADARGGVAEVVCVCRNIHMEKQRQERLEYMSNHDPLTGALNRFAFEDALRCVAAEKLLNVGIVLTDLNGLKMVNDAFGHEQGDALLKEAVQLLNKACGGQHPIYRMGGGEFALVMYGTTARQIERLCAAIERECKKTARRAIPLSLSQGTALRTGEGEDIRRLYVQAESAMHASKLLDSRSMRSHLLASLKEALRVRNLETADHTQRMEHMVTALGKRLGLAGVDFDRLVLLASMHDIGKVAIPDAVINKPGPLTKSEWVIMRTHSEIGARIAATSQELRVVTDEIAAHHEHWNGGGYPSGIAGEDIPLLARIISVVDAYDVMTHRRVYKEPVSHEVAIAELRRCAGTQFDPAIVTLFLDIFGALSHREMESFTSK